MFGKIALSAAAVSAAVLLSGCGNLFGAESSSETSAVTEQTFETRQYIKTTKTMSNAVKADENDEDIEGYTTTSEVTGSLENSYSVPDEPDEDILATYSTTTTLYTIPKDAVIKTTTTAKSTKKTTTKKTETKATETTPFTANKLYKPAEADMLDKKVKFHIVSDTTYLNLRFGPSKKYDVQLQIPDGEYVYGTAVTTDPDNKDQKWVYVSYNGTSGWVIRELLERA